MLRSTRAIFAAGLLALLAGSPAARAEPSVSAGAVQYARLEGQKAEFGQSGPAIAKAQIMLDRAHVSPGVIDGIYGGNTKKAIAAFQFKHGVPVTGVLDQKTWNALRKVSDAPVIRTHVITREDVDGPFVDKIPDSFSKMAKMERLAYTSPLEKLAEDYHMTPDLLQQLNPNASFDKAGTKIFVANVRNNPPSGDVKTIIVNKRNKSVKGVDANGNIVVFYPATIGSESNPAPSGRYEVNAIAKRPVYHYNPSLGFQDVDAKSSLKIPPGPNNPVGLVWIDLTKENYGIHGTPAPAKISKTYSHGCIRLTNWDALELAERVDKGTPVLFKK